MAAPGTNEWLEDYVMQIMKSPSWSEPIEHFIEEKCSIFDLAGTEENKLEYTIVHNEFKEIVESLLVAHLLDVDITPDQFAGACEASILAAQSGAQADSKLDAIVSQIVSVGDFGVFKQMMTSRFLAQQQALMACHSPALAEPVAVVAPPSRELAPALAAAPSVPACPTGPMRASRIANIIQSANKEKASNTDKAAVVRQALNESAWRMKALHRAGA